MGDRSGAWVRHACGVLAGIVVLVASLAAGAQEPTLEVRLEPQRPGVEDVAQLTVTVIGAQNVVSQPQLGEMENLHVIGGPSTSRRFSMVNGQTSTSISFAWAVQAVEEGPIRVGAVEVQLASGTLRSQPFSTEAVAGRQKPVRPPQRRVRSPFEELMSPSSERRSAKVELRLVVERDEVVVGQPLPVTVALDTTANVSSFEWLEPPTFPGWWSQAVEDNDPSQSQQVEVRGVRFWRFPVARFMLIPLRSGELKLPQCAARVMLRGDGFFARPQVLERSADEVSVTVVERPQSPPGFAGAVGDLRYRVSVEPREVEVGEPVIVTVELDGDGNLPLVETPPEWSGCESCEWYPPEESSTIAVEQNAIRGSRQWRTTVLPRTSGEFSLGPVSVAVYDPSRQTYRRQSLGPLQVVVKAPPTTPTPPPSMAPQSAGQHADGDVDSSQATAVVWPWVLAGMLAGVVAGAAVVWWVLRRPHGRLPPRRSGERPADRARTLQSVLEGWWLGVPETRRSDTLRVRVDELRRQLEAIRFAPGRADHSETVERLEEELRKLLH